jgi:hypothetical protein
MLPLNQPKSIPNPLKLISFLKIEIHVEIHVEIGLEIQL